MSPAARRVDAAVLAAGLAERLGGAKHLLIVERAPMLEHVVRALQEAGVPRVTVVLRAGDDAGERLARALGAETVVAESPDEGRAASLRAAVRDTAREAEALLVALADQPFLLPEDFAALIDGFRAGDAGIVHASYRGQRGSPALFARRYFPSLLALRGDDGGRKVIAAHKRDARAVDLPPARGRDVDRLEDLP